MLWYYALLQFYVSLVTYTILHMIFVISSDFVEAFNIPPLNIGIYVDKLAAIRALLMVIADVIEWGITQKACEDGGTQSKALKDLWNGEGFGKKGSRRMGSIVSFLGMLSCRIAYLIIVYKSDNKSLSVFITLCVEGFWFGLFQMGFFAIGPEYNAYTSLGIHTMGNFIFFLQLILQSRAKTKPKINCLYRVRVHGWICVATSILALILWLVFCFTVTAKGEDAPNQWPHDDDVWSPFWLFIVGAFAEDFSVPGILPFAFLDPDKANLVNYLTPVFFMSGAILIVLWNDWTKDESKFKDWSASTDATEGKYWHSLWTLNIPKYIAFFIAMWSIHGTYGDLRCIIQSRWRVLVLTMTVVVPRATLEVAGYVGVANWAIGRADLTLGELAKKLNTAGIDNTGKLTANELGGSNGLDNEEVKTAIQQLIGDEFPEVKNVTKENISASKSSDTVNVTLGSDNSQTAQAQGEAATVKGSVTIQIQQKGTTVTGLNATNGHLIAKRLAKACLAAPNAANARRDFEAFTYIALHDMLAMFCRFVYGKFAVGYNQTNICVYIYS